MIEAVKAVKFWGCLLACVGLISLPLAAEEKPTRGRLPDGRAYRIDEGGYKLIDQLAEMEVTNDDLQRQVRALENEVDAQRSQLQRLTGGDASKLKGKISETNIVTAGKGSPALAHTVREISADSASTAAMESQLSSLRQQLSVAQEELSRTKLALEQSNIARANADNAALTQQQLQAQARNLDLELRNKEVEKSALSDSLANLNKNAEQLRAELVAKNSELAAKNSELEQKNNALLAAKQEIAMREEKLKTSEQQIAALNSQLTARASLAVAKTTQAAPTPVKSAQIEKSKSSDSMPDSNLARYRSEFSSKLAAIQSLIGERKNLYDRVKSGRNGLSVSLSPLVSKSGASLDNLRLKVKQLSDYSDADYIKIGLMDIEKILSDDISLIKRISKL
jgi:chromosome segregation ATPase